jgi:hypothetical protein
MFFALIAAVLVGVAPTLDRFRVNDPRVKLFYASAQKNVTRQNDGKILFPVCK